jgi:hypothetical protein
MVVVPNAEWLVLASRCILNKKVPFNFSMKDLVIMLCIYRGCTYLIINKKTY